MNEDETIVVRLKAHAETWIYSGLISSPLEHLRLNSSRRYNRTTGVVLLYTRDSGHYSAGWFKNPDYERCYHLSISFRDPETRAPIPFDRARAAAWVAKFFHPHADKLWCDPAYTPEGKQLQVVHYRLFCDPGWQAIKPRGEVYNRDFTEAGWKSFSEIHGEGVGEFSWGTPG